MPVLSANDDRRLAICLWDLDRLPADLKGKLLGGRLDLSKAIKISSDGVETGVAFTCGMLEGAIICDLIRNGDRKVGDRPTRCYLWRQRGWFKFPMDSQLTTVSISGTALLNPEYFGDGATAASIAAEAPPATVLTVGRKSGGARIK